MSPASLRRYRAERLLREEFRALRGQVIANVRGGLRARGASLDQSDLEACYAQAWQGLYAATLEGQRIVNPAGWLSVVTFRRAIDEHRARARIGLSDPAGPARADGDDRLDAAAGGGGAAQPDFATELDDRTRLRQLFEALRLRLSGREQQAAALCYLQGLTRAEAARTMGVGEARMHKLMDGPGGGRPGVAGKVGALVGTIRDGEWCEEQGSLMRGFAYGILDPEGERYQLALAHSSGCPACRAYVASLRGLAALLPPVPAMLHWALLGGAVGARAACQGGGAGGALPAAGAISSPVAMSGAAAGVGAGGGSWLLAGGASTKLAASCLLALGVGAGCAVLGAGRVARAPVRAHAHAAAPAAVSRSVLPAGDGGRAVSVLMRPAGGAAGRAAAAALAPSAASRARREFGPEHALAAPSSERSRAPAPTASTPSVSARVASAGGEFTGGGPPSSSGPAAAASAPAQAARAGAQREFSPG